MRFWNSSNARIIGSAGELIIPSGDEVTPRLMMLLEGECEGLVKAAEAAHASTE